MSSSQELLVLVPKITSRIRYIFDWIFSDLLNEIEIIEDKNRFLDYPGPKFQYGGKQVEEDILFWPASPLLFEHGIHTQSIDISSEKIIFRSADLENSIDI